MPIPIPVATAYVSRVTAEIPFSFRCARCRTKANARVRATSKGSAIGGPAGAFGTKAVNRANAKALAGLQAEGADLVELARCPACGLRNPGALSGLWIVKTTQLALVVALFVVAPSLVFPALRGFSLGVAILVLLLVSLLYLAVVTALRVRQVDARVVFLDGASADASRADEVGDQPPHDA